MPYARLWKGAVTILRDITIGRYVNGNSPLHRADARIKLICMIVYSASMFACDSLLQLGAASVFTAIAIFISRLPLSYCIKGLKPLRWIILATMILNLFSSEGDIILQWSVFHITDMGIITAVKTASKLMLFALTASLMTLTTPPILLTDGIARLMKPLKIIRVPADDIAMMISITLRFLPTLADDAERIMKAQRARCAVEEKGLFGAVRGMTPIIIPLFITAFRHSEELAVAMESRCYGKGARKPRRRSVFGGIDAAICGIMLLFCIFLGFLKFYH